MPIPTRGCLRWLVAAAALLLLASPAPADEIEPEPYPEQGSEEPAPSGAVDAEEAEPAADAAAADDTDTDTDTDGEAAEAAGEPAADEPNIARAFDFVLLRPLYLVRLAAGLPFFVFYPLTISSGWEDDVVSALWTDPYEATFVRPLGESFGEDY
ncbi:MAG TPA: hypothetical protein VEC18_02855 [Myxococcota bacterium]|nr:hypothetical protein [Myxococcota bacterium]